MSLIVYNNTQNRYISQENYSHSQNIPLTSKLLEDNYILPAKGKKYRNAEMQFIDLIALMCPTLGSTTQQSSSQISALIKKGRSATNEGIRRAIKNGAVKVTRRRIGPKLWASNIYSLTNEFYDDVLRRRMCILFPNLDDSIAQPKREKMKCREMNRQVMRENMALQKARRVSEIDNFQSHEVCPEDIDIPSDSSREVVAKILFADNDGIMVKKPHDLQKTDILLRGNICTRTCDENVEWYGDSQSTYTYTGEINQGEPTTGVGEDLFSLSNEFKSESISVLNKKGSTAMQVLPTVQEILTYANELKSIRPLLHGAIILSAFPKEVVLHADERTLKCKKPLPTALDRWKYLISVCKGYCAENNIETSWAMTLNIRDRYSIHKDTPMFDEAHTPAPSSSISFKVKSTGVQTSKPQVTYEEAVRNNQQWSNSLPHLDKQAEFENAIDTLTQMAATNPFAALLMKSVDKLKPQTVGCPQNVVVEPVKPFDAETLQIVEWIKSNWDDTLFPHSNKWVHDNISRVLSEGPTSPQYLDGSFMNGMKRIKMLMVELLKKPKVNPIEVKPIVVKPVQSIPVQVQPNIEDDEVSVDYSSDPFGDRQ